MKKIVYKDENGMYGLTPYGDKLWGIAMGVILVVNIVIWVPHLTS